jgi:hypothetical protein
MAMRGIGSIASLFQRIRGRLFGGSQDVSPQERIETYGVRQVPVQRVSPMVAIQPLPPEVQARIDAMVRAKSREIDPTGERMKAEMARAKKPNGGAA